ncbi:CDGSH iron-sulfur domain-containing protein 3, mitochondrial [Toxorhynchites rutilus septentrionalis]|uniref:CDGSH iron-sulfur domain-containing protein 3, mitochondrial n=1 Tax=Toxorhynchites rutilus septentrionalis TaxID=329112 RepID=UPI002478F1D7|nr:CDGSH iron-sulfur domain-containing protein 3, mitochondrial [Toxorhynchites rutilus septentrionalis]
MNSVRNILCRRFTAKTSVEQKWFSSTPVQLSDTHIPKNVIADLSTAQHQHENGMIYDKKPFKIELVEGKRYSWCLCGKSKSQPLCDGTHKLEQYKITLRPVRFQVEKTGTYWLCNCKQTKNRPFCDGTHKAEHIQKITGK